MILGGSTPFTSAFFEACRDSLLPPLRIVLYGRSLRALRALRAYGEARLGTPIETSTELKEALQGADVVIQQIRFGDLALRQQGEQLAARFGLLGDETLGPAALLTSAIATPALQNLGQALALHCPKAWILNLTNPLSLATSLLAQHQPRCLGFCELPSTTMGLAADLLQIPRDQLQWDYTGLNHRGFLHNLRYQGADLKPLLQGIETWQQCTTQEITALEALPMKYFASACHPPQPQPSRAAFLMKLRATLLDEIERDPQHAPPSITQRAMPWYPQAVVPALEALLIKAKDIVVNHCGEDGITREQQVTLSWEGIKPKPCKALTGEAATWNTRFLRHEEAMLQASLDPSFDNLHRALTLDPACATLPNKEPLTQAVFEAINAQLPPTRKHHHG